MSSPLDAASERAALSRCTDRKSAGVYFSPLVTPSSISVLLFLSLGPRAPLINFVAAPRCRRDHGVWRIFCALLPTIKALAAFLRPVLRSVGT